MDLVVYGATPGGIACAVRAAREGLRVHLVSHSAHLGGMLTNGLSTMDTLYNGSRAPIYDEIRSGIYDYYRTRYGKDSPQFNATQPGHPKTRYEAHVVERLFETMLAAESRITISRGYYPVRASVDGVLLQSATFRKMDAEELITIAADAFADCSYEADLAQVVGLPYRVGRESRHEFGEQHAGVIYMRRLPWPPPQRHDELVVYERTLNLFQYDAWYEKIESASTGEAHPAVQGYNLRTIVTDDPGNRIPIEKPKDYDPAQYREFGFGNPNGPGLAMPNRKFGLNEPKLVGRQDPYVEGNWTARRAVTDAHREATLGLLYFRQNDPSVPSEVRAAWKEFGLPRDEFADNGHMPYEIYARETRRIVGRAIFTENDAQLAPRIKRAPVHADSISITEWFLDSHACTPREVEGSESEGMVMLKNQTFPGQVPFRTLLPERIDNCLVPVCLSSSHVGWGTIRLEPTWMSISESAAVAVSLARKLKTTPAAVDTESLLRELAERRVLLSFFNDIENCETKDWYPAVQYLGTKGYFGSYDARPDVALSLELASAWIDLTASLARRDDATPLQSAEKCWQAESKGTGGIVAATFLKQLVSALDASDAATQMLTRLSMRWDIPENKPISRGDACRLIFAVLSGVK